MSGDRRDAPEPGNASRTALFREDLFHRSTSSVSACRPCASGARYPLLTRHFLQKSARELGVETKRLSRPP